MNICCSRPTSYTPYELVFGQHLLRYFNMVEEWKQCNVNMEEDLPEDIIENGEGSENEDNNDIIENGEGSENENVNDIIENGEGSENEDDNDIIENGKGSENVDENDNIENREGSENVDYNDSLCYDCDDFNDTDGSHILHRKFNYDLTHLEVVENNKGNEFSDFENEGNRVEISQDKVLKPIQMFNVFRSTRESTQPDNEISIIALSSFSQSSAFSDTTENDYTVLQDNGVSKDVEMLSEQTIDNAIDDQERIRDKVVIDL
ncbi:hypothetical protein C2G38_878827 [Gigaspora rosea]|uniref:Uncharacterized protein n=1 Tax=Gigaspora rosea TaxID=44941 RepID=A0A397WCJ9_9GLOM|nr:hypothetical protein C2G38_878827 [Gigaspora rosea]